MVHRLNIYLVQLTPHTHTQRHALHNKIPECPRMPFLKCMHACGTKGHLEGGLWLYRSANLPARPTPP